MNKNHVTMNKKYLLRVFCYMFVAGFLFFAHANSASAFACLSNVNPSGNYSASGSWTSCNNTIPQSTDTVEIAAGDTITVDTSARTMAGLKINSTGSLTLSQNITVTGTGTGVNGFYVDGTTTGTGTILLSGSGATIDGVGNVTSGTVSISTAKTIASTANITFTGQTIAITAAITVTNNGIVTTTGTGGITGSASGSTWNNAASTSVLNFGGSTTSLLSTGTLTATAAGNTINYNQNGAQTCKVVTYINLTLSGGGAKTCLATTITNMTLSNGAGSTTWTIGAATVVSGTLTINSGVVVTKGSANVAVNMSGTSSISGELDVTSTTGSIVFGNMTINNGGLVNFTAAEITTISGNLQVDGTGSITSNSGVWTFSGASKTLTGTATSVAIQNPTFASGSSYSNSITTFTSSGTITVNDNFTNNSTGAVSAATLTVASAKTYTDNGTTTVTTTLSGSGIYTIGATGTLNYNSTGTPAIAISTFTAPATGSTVNYSGNGAQTVKAVTYSNLGLGGTGSNTKTTTSVTTINGNLIMSGTAAVTTGTFTTVGGFWEQDGTSAYTMAATTNLAVTGAFTVGDGSSAATFTSASTDTLTVTGAATIAASSTYAHGSSGLVTFNDNLTINGTMNGSGTGNFIAKKDVSGTGTFNGTSYGSSEIFNQDVAANKTFGPTGSNSWTFQKLYFSNSTTDGTDVTISGSVTSTGNITVSVGIILGTDQAGGADTGGDLLDLDGGSKTWTLSGSTPLTLNNSDSFCATGTCAGGVSAANTSVFSFTNNSAVTIPATNYYTLECKPGGNAAAQVLGTASGQTFTIAGNFNVGDGTTGHIGCSAVTNDPIMNITGNMTIANAATYAASDLGSKSMTVSGTFAVNDGGTYTGNASTLSVTGAATVGQGSTGTFTGSSGNISYANTLTVNAGASYTTGANNTTLSLAGTPLSINATATFTVTSGNQITYTGDGALITCANVSYYNLGLDPTTTQQTICTATGQTLTVTNNLNVTHAGAKSNQYATNPIINISGNMSVYSNGVFTAGASSLNITGGLSVGITSFVGTFQGGNGAVNIVGNLAITSGSTWTKGAGTVTLKKGDSTQTWTDSSASGQDLGTVVIAVNSGNNTTVTSSGKPTATSITINDAQTLATSSSTLTVTTLTVGNGASGTFTGGSGNTTINGVLTVNASATYTTGANTTTLSLAGTPISKNATATFTVTSANVMKYTGDGATVTCTGISYYDLELKPSASAQQVICPSTSQTLTVTHNLTVGDGSHAGATASNNPAINVTGTTTIAAGAVFTTGTGTWTQTSTLTVTGTLSGSANGAINAAGNIAGAGTINLTGGSLTATGNAATIIAGTYYNLLLEPSSGSAQVLGSGTFTVGGNLTVGDGTAGHQGADADTNDPTINITGTMTVANAATFTGSSSAALTITGATTIGGGTSGVFTESGGAINLLGNLTISAGATFTKNASTTLTFKKGATQTVTDNTSGQDLGALKVSAGAGGSNYSLIASTVKGQGALPTDAIDTTGADLLVMVLEVFDDTTAVAPTDSKSNTWTQATGAADSGSGRYSRIWYSQGGTVGSGHTFNHTGTVARIAIYAFSGSTSSPLDQTNHSSNVDVSTAQPGSVTPSQDNELLVVGSYEETVSGTSGSVNSSFTGKLEANDNTWGLISAYKIQTTAGAENPTITYSSTNHVANLSIATFKASGGGAGGVTTLSTSSNVKATSITVDASQNLDISSDTLTLTGASSPLVLSGSNTFTVTGSTVNYSSASSPTIANTTYNNLTISGTISGVTASATVGGTFLNSGTFSPNAGTLTLTGTTLTNNGTMTASGSHTVVLSNAGTTNIGGSAATTFYNLTDTTDASTIKFVHGQTYTFAGTLTVTGGASKITITSDDDANQWLAVFNADQTSVSNAIISWSGCDAGNTHTETPTTSTDNNHNGDCWVFGVSIAGVMYTDTAGTAAFDCSGANNRTLKVSIAGALHTRSATCNQNTGVFSIPAATVATGNVVEVFVDDGTAANQGALIFKATGSTAISGLQLIKGYVTIADNLANTDLVGFCHSGCTTTTNAGNVPFDYSSGNISVTAGHGLIVWTGKTFTPGGTVTLPAASATAGAEGDLEIQASSVLDMAGNALSIGGDYTNAGTLTVASPQTTTFTGTGTGFTITKTGTGSFDNVTFNGSTGDWSLAQDSTPTGNVTITAGDYKLNGHNLTIASGKQITIANSSSATLDNGSGTLLLNGSGTAGSRPFVKNASGVFTASTGSVDYEGTSATEVETTTYNNLKVGIASNATSTTYSLNGNPIVGGVLTVGLAGNSANPDILDITNRTVTLSGPTDPLSVTAGASMTVTGSTVNYTSTSATNIFPTIYNNLSFTPASSATYTLPNTNLTLRGNLSIGANTTVTKGSGTMIFAKGGTQNLTDSESTPSDLGAIQVSSNSTDTVVIATTSIKLTSVTLDPSQTLNWNCLCGITVTGSGTPLSIGASASLNNGAAIVTFLGTSNTNIPGINYGSITITPASGSPTYTWASGNQSYSVISDNIVYGDGSHAVTVDNSANGINLYPRGNLTLNAGATYTAGGSINFEGADQVVTDSNSTKSNLGIVTVDDAINSSKTLRLGSSLTATKVQLSNSKVILDLNGSNTLTLTGSGTGASRPLKNVDGAFTASTGTVDYEGTSATDVEALTYNNLKVGIDSNATATTYTLNGDTTVGSVLTVGLAGNSANKDILDLSSRTLTLSGSTDPLVVTAGGTFTPSTSTVNYTGTSATNITATTYNNLSFTPGSAATYTMPGSTLTLRGNLAIGANTTVTKGAGTILFARTGAGTSTLTDSEATPSDLGAIQVSNGGGATTLSTSSNVKATSITVDSSQNLNIDSDTLTLTGTSTPLTLSGSNTFTVTGSTVNYTGDGASTILATTYNNLGLKPSSSSQQVLSSGTFTVNGNLTVGDGTSDHEGATAATNDPIINITGNTTIAANATMTPGTGAWTLTGDLTIDGLLGNPGDNNTITVGGSITGSGSTFITSTIVQRVTSGKNFGSTSGNSDWVIGHLTFGNGNSGATPVTITTQTGGSGLIIIQGNTNIGKSGDATGATTTLDAGNRTWRLNTNANPLTILSSPQGVLTANASTFNYEGIASTTVAGATYYNLGVGIVAGSQASTAYTLGGNTTVSNTLTIGNASSNNADILDLSSRILTLSGSGTPLNITSKGTLTASTSTVNYTGTSATNITAATYNNLSFTPGSAATYTLSNSNTTLRGNLSIGANTSVTKGSGTMIFARSSTGTSTLTDSEATPSDLGAIQVSDGGGTTTLSTSSNLKATSITVDSSQNLNIDSDTVTLTGTGTPLALSGSNTFTVTGSTFKYVGVGSTNITSTTYNILKLVPGGDPTYKLGTGASQTVTVGGDLQLGDGSNALTVDAATYDPNINVGGNLAINAQVTYQKGASGILKFNKGGAATWTDNASGQDIGHVKISNDGAGHNTTVALAANVKAQDATIDASQTLDLTGYSLILTADGTALTNNGTLTVSTTDADGVITGSTLEFAPACVPDCSSGVTVPGLTYYSLKLNKVSNTFTAGGNITAHDLDINAGEFVAPSGTLTVNGNFTNDDTFTHNSGTVAITPVVEQPVITIGGANDTDFYNLSASSATLGDFSLKLPVGNTLNVAHNFTVTGSSDSKILLESDNPGDQWTIYVDPDATVSVSNTIVFDSACGDSSHTFGPSSTLLNGGHNGSCWIFNVRSRGGGGGAAGGEGSGNPNPGVGGGGAGGGGGTGDTGDTGTCVDGIQNGNETGIDTGGRCTPTGGGGAGGGGGDSG